MSSLNLNPSTPTELELNVVSANVSDAKLKEWTNAEAYEPTGTISRDSNGVPTSFAVTWPDGSAGEFTTTANDGSSGAINAYTITHADSGKTVTQPEMTRDANGAVSSKPALTVT